jgi:hypothetical protein
VSIAAHYQAFKQLGLQLDMSRGKPAPEQLDLSNALAEALGGYCAADGSDARNYGGAVGLPEARAGRAPGGGRPQHQGHVAREAGIMLMPAGAAFPYGVDPRDRHIRIAPSFPSLAEIRQAAQGIALSLRLALESGPAGA